MDPFIVTTSLEKPAPDTRKAIRSHVMRGRNRRNRIPGLSLEEILGNGSGVKSRPRSDQVQDDCCHQPQVTPAPGRQIPGSAFAFTRFATEMEPDMIGTVHTYFTIVKQSLYPVEACSPYNATSSIWFEYLEVDAVYLQSLLWAAQSLSDLVRGQPPSNLSLLQKARSLAMLQGRINGDDEMTSDSTIAAILTLVMANALAGDFEAAVKHMSGLSMMVMLRGGVDSLAHNRQVQIKIYRTDLGVSLMTGSRPRFSFLNYHGVGMTPQDQPVHVPAQELSRSSNSTWLELLDMQLVQIWEEMRFFCGCTNASFAGNVKMDPETFQEMLVSILYSLMFLSFGPDDVNEVVRLSLLAFAAGILLQTHEMRVRLQHLVAQLRNGLLRQRRRQRRQVGLAGAEFSVLRAWIHLVTRLAAVTDEDDGWLLPLLADSLREAGLHTYAEAKEAWKDLLWIDFLHNVDSRTILRTVVTQGP